MLENVNEEKRAIEDIKIPSALPILPMSDVVVFPYIVIPLAITSEVLIKRINESLSTHKLLALLTLREDGSGFYNVGTVGAVVRMLKMTSGSVRLMIQGVSRVEVRDIDGKKGIAKIKPIVSRKRKKMEIEALKRNAVECFQKIIQLSPDLTEDLQELILKIGDTAKLADFIAANMEISISEKQQILEALDVRKRLDLLVSILMRELKVLELGDNIRKKAKGELTKDQREYFLREQLKVIRDELGEGDERSKEIEDLTRSIERAEMSDEAREVADRELVRLSRMSVSSAEYHVSRTYLDWLISLPWKLEMGRKIDIKKAREILDRDHYDLDEVKERIVEYLAIRKLKPDVKGPVLCFAGPPGVGKTSLGRSIAEALGRGFCRVSLGGIRDEAEIRGHRRTYVGSLPGRIIQSVVKTKAKDPVFMLDEIDKLGIDFRGDPSSALLEALDPEQNHVFSDHYLEIPFDLSKVIFITTANLIHPIPSALQDRMEVIEIPGYTSEEKQNIAKKFLLPRRLSESGLKRSNVLVTDGVIRKVIQQYTRESGVRNLERELGKVLRKVAVSVVSGDKKKKRITVDNLIDYLGPEKYVSEMAGRKDEIGVATGLAWTAVGGKIMFIEVTRMKGTGKRLQLTGHLGDVMKESAQAALSFLKSNPSDWGIPGEAFKNYDLHIHIPAGATPKDGPSAGVSILTALTSILSGKPVRHDVSMTGEITLKGKVLAVGGIREKILAAKEAGIKTVILPEGNRSDLTEISKEIADEMQFIMVDHVSGVLKYSLREDGKVTGKKSSRNKKVSK
jgi:ATP-dependent Lon protease